MCEHDPAQTHMFLHIEKSARRHVFYFIASGRVLTSPHRCLYSPHTDTGCIAASAAETYNASCLPTYLHTSCLLTYLPTYLPYIYARIYASCLPTYLTTCPIHTLIYASCIALHTLTTSQPRCRSQIVAVTRNMFAYIIMYGRGLPRSWRDEDTVVIVFFQGEFTACAFANCIVPMCLVQAFAMPVVAGTELHTWSWTGPVTCRSF